MDGLGLTNAFAVRAVNGGVQFAVRVQPGAKREGIAGTYGEAIKVAITAPAVDGKANEALVRFLSERFEIPRSRIAIIAGETSRSKVVRLLDLTADAVMAALS